jgi:hypothetical protein
MPVVVDALAYFPLPKAANTSLKLAMYQLAFGRPYGQDPGLPGNIHHYAPWRTEPFRASDRLDYAGHTRFAMVRDPIDRLLSAYVHRVLMRETLSADQMARRGVDPGLPATPDLHTFIDNLQQYQRLSRGVRHHTVPMVDFLGPDPAFYARLFPVEDIAAAQAWLSEVSGREVIIPHQMASDRRHGREDLTAAQIARLRDIYRDDYRFLAEAGMRTDPG